MRRRSKHTDLYNRSVLKYEALEAEVEVMPEEILCHPITRSILLYICII